MFYLALAAVPFLLTPTSPQPSSLESSLAGQKEDAFARAAENFGWHVEEDEKGRWRLFSTVSPALSREAITLIGQFYERLDDLIGAETAAGSREPVNVFFFGQKSDATGLAQVIGERWPHLGPWANAASEFARFHHWKPLISVIRHDSSLASVVKPEIQVAHNALQMELARRYGRLPFWVAEAFGYAMQEERTGGIYGYSYRTEGQIDDQYHLTWRKGAIEALQGANLSIARLSKGSGKSFDQERAYLQFALAHWAMVEERERLSELFQAYVDLRAAVHQIDVEWEPTPEEQAKAWETAFGADLFDRVKAYWAEVPISATGEAVPPEETILAAIAATIEKHEIPTYRSKNKRFWVASDFNSKSAKNAMKKAESILSRFDKVFGKPTNPEAATLWAMLIEDRDFYHALCDAIADADPTQASAMEQFKQLGGFTIYNPPLTVYFHDKTVQEEARPDHSVAHNIVHAELYRRFGILPLWLAEGMACAGEEHAFGEVWANWYRDGFVFTVSHAGWRNAAAKIVERSQEKKSRGPGLPDLYAYKARPYEDDLAHFAFAFSTYGLEADPKGLKQLMQVLQKEYETKWTSGGRFQPLPSRMDAMVTEAFGEDFAKKFHSWWTNSKKWKPKKRR